MTLHVMKQRIAEASPRLRGRIAAAFCVLSILAGVIVFVAGGRLGVAAEVIATAFYIGVTVFLYVLIRGA